MHKLLASFSLLLLFSAQVHSEKFELAIEHSNNDLYSYAISLLKLALENDTQAHSLNIREFPLLTHGRLFDKMHNSNKYNIVVSGLHENRVKKGYLVRVPISRGLLGHRLLVINKSNFELMKTITSLNALKTKISIGSGYGWIDTKVLKHHGFNVHVASYEQLWKMLSKHRFIGFNRGLHEAFSELEIFAKQYPGNIVYPYIIIQYKFDYFFYTKNKRLRNILENSLSKIYENGLFMKHFNNHPQIKNALQQLDYDKLKIYPLNNPFLPTVVKEIPRSYWHDIQSIK